MKTLASEASSSAAPGEVNDDVVPVDARASKFKVETLPEHELLAAYETVKADWLARKLDHPRDVSRLLESRTNKEGVRLLKSGVEVLRLLSDLRIMSRLDAEMDDGFRHLLERTSTHMVVFNGLFEMFKRRMLTPPEGPED